MKIEQNNLSDAPAVIIGTPGRLADHIFRKSFEARTVKMVVLDEFDKSLQMGFHEQLRIIFNALTGKQKNTYLPLPHDSMCGPNFCPSQNPKHSTS